MNTINFTSVNDFIGKEYNAYLCTITPSIAEEMLSASIGNRKLDNSNVIAIHRDIVNNDYHFSVPGSGVAFDVAGRLVNGHHTLTAFLRSGKPSITVTLFTGAEHLDKCDTGKSRTLRDTAVMSGNDACKEVCKLAVNILRIKSGKVPSNTGSKKEFANSVIFDFCNKHLVELSELNNELKAYKKKINKKNEGIGRYPKGEESVLAALMWELIHEEGFNPELVKNFAYGIITINTHPNTIVDKFRKQINKDARLSNKNGAMSFADFRTAFKDNFYKFVKSTNKIAM